MERLRRATLDGLFNGSKRAEKGELVYNVRDEVACAARPVLEASSKEIIAIGKVGDATTISGYELIPREVQAADEGALVSRSGLRRREIRGCNAGNGSYSATLEMNCRCDGRQFEPHFS